MYKVDLHTHSTQSKDGGISPDEYRKIIETQLLDFVAITDHNEVETALGLRSVLGEQIIVGEEIMTRDGEIIGLFLSKKIEPNKTIQETIHEIKKQKGLVYIPHPFETIRKGLSEEVMNSVRNDIDIVEIYNSRALIQNQGPKAATWCRLNGKAGGSSSDAHGIKGVGSAYSLVEKPPTSYNLVKQLETAHYATQRTSLRGLLYPKINRVKKKFK